MLRKHEESYLERKRRIEHCGILAFGDYSFTPLDARSAFIASALIATTYLDCTFKKFTKVARKKKAFYNLTAELAMVEEGGHHFKVDCNHHLILRRGPQIAKHSKISTIFFSKMHSVSQPYLRQVVNASTMVVYIFFLQASGIF